MKKGYVFASLFFLGGCTVGSDYHKPDLKLPTAWINAKEVLPSIAEDVSWWQNYNDPILTDLVKQTVQFNMDLKTAFARVRQARAFLAGSKANLYPEFDSSGSLTHNKSSENSQFYMGSANNPSLPYYDLFTLGVATSWELDLFGRLRRGEEEAQASFEAQIHDTRGVIISLIAEVAQSYINLRSYQQQLKITKRSYELWNSIYQLTQDLFKSGLAIESDVLQAKASRDAMKANLFPLEAKIKIEIHHLSILVGQAPGTLYPLLSKPSPIPETSLNIRAGLPSELLERRPDICVAEQNLVAAHAHIGVVQGDLFPKFSLTGNFGYESNKGSNFFNSQSSTFGFGPSFTWPVLDFGRIRANIDSTTALRDENFFKYKSVVLRALEEVENALVNLSTEEKRYQNLKRSFKAQKNAADIILTRFEAGQNDFLGVLQSEITAQTMKINMIQSKTTLLLNTIALYRALGGGWKNLLPTSKGPKIS